MVRQLAEEIALRLRAEPALGLEQARAVVAELGADEGAVRIAYRLARRWASGGIAS